MGLIRLTNSQDAALWTAKYSLYMTPPKVARVAYIVQGLAAVPTNTCGIEQMVQLTCKCSAQFYGCDRSGCLPLSRNGADLHTSHCRTIPQWCTPVLQISRHMRNARLLLQSICSVPCLLRTAGCEAALNEPLLSGLHHSSTTVGRQIRREAPVSEGKFA